jgi:prevent-host-death family protein
MRTVNIAELKNRLSSYVGYAKAGETIIVRDRNRPVAQLVPFLAGDASEEELTLVAAGEANPPKKRMDLQSFFLMSKPTVQGSAAMQALLDDRNESL